MTYEDVKLIRENPTSEDYNNTEFQRMIDTAVEKQIPKEPDYPWDTKEPQCPLCESGFIGEPKYCSNCGQALKWGGGKE